MERFPINAAPTDSALRFDGQVVVVTGGAHGMGAAHVREFVAHGARVAILDVDAAAAHQMATECGDHVISVPICSSPGAARPAVRVVEYELGPIDVVVNNAGIAVYGGIDAEPTDLERLLDVHLRLPIELTRAAWPSLVARAGRVVNVVSNAALFGKADMLAYAASKGALLAWSRSLALAAESEGVAVNAVAPVAATRLTQDVLAGRSDLVSPAAVARVVAWLAHRDCPERGATISVVGGAVARVVPARVPLGVVTTIEEVRSALDAPLDLTAATVPASAADEFTRAMDELERAAGPEETGR